MSEVKRFRITGHLRKGGENLAFKKEIKAIKKEHALATLYADMGSRHKARKFMITVKTIEEVPEAETGAEA